MSRLKTSRVSVLSALTVLGWGVVVGGIQILQAQGQSSGENRGTHAKEDKPDKYLYICAGDELRIHPDFLMVVDFNEDSANYGRIIATADSPTSSLVPQQAQQQNSEALSEIDHGESINYGIWVCDPQGRNTHASQSFLKLVGMTQRECSEFGWGNVLHPQDAEATIAAWKQCARTGQSWYREHRFRGVDGQWHPILACGVPVRDERGDITCWAGINLDISQLKRTEEQLRKTKNELAGANANLGRVVAERTAKLQELVGELEHFSYTITHDLKSPLRAMRGFAEMASMACEEHGGKEAIEFLARISSAAERMDRLIADALNYSRTVRQELPLEDVDAGALLRGILRVVKLLTDVFAGSDARKGGRSQRKMEIRRAKNPVSPHGGLVQVGSNKAG